MVLVQLTIKDVLPKSNPLAALALFAPVAAACLLPLSAWLEPGALRALAGSAAEVGLASWTVQLLAMNCCAAVALNACAVWLLSHESGPLVITLVGVLKDIEIIVFAVFAFASPLTLKQVVGYGVALFGLNVYHIFKQPGGAEAPLGRLLAAAATNATAVAIVAGLGAMAAASHYVKTERSDESLT